MKASDNRSIHSQLQQVQKKEREEEIQLHGGFVERKKKDKMVNEGEWTTVAEKSKHTLVISGWSIFDIHLLDIESISKAENFVL